MLEALPILPSTRHSQDLSKNGEQHRELEKLHSEEIIELEKPLHDHRNLGLKKHRTSLPLAGYRKPHQYWRGSQRLPKAAYRKRSAVMTW